MSTNPEHTGTLPSSRFRWIFLYLALLLGLCLPVAGSATWLSDETHKGRILTPPPVQTAARWQDDYDAENYSLTIDIDFDRLMISGTMTLSGKTLMSNFDELVLNLTDSLTVTSIQRAGNALSFTHTDSLLTISLDTIFQPDDTWSVTVDFEGHPPTGGFLGFEFGEHDGHAIASSLSQPTHAHNWWPCKDVIDDKALVNLAITVPDTMIAVSNGMPFGTSVPGPGRLTFDWRGFHRIAPYLVSLTATNYVTWQENYITAASDTIPVHFYAYPEKQTEAAEDWNITVPVLSMFAGAFGQDYPFIDEKFGMAMFESGASMEHQTCPSYASHLVTGDHRFDSIAVHEIAHQWWGNLVTPAEWNDIWLAEGFATWSEAHWAELSWGGDAYRNYMRSLDTGFFQGPIYAPDYLFSRTVYKKGAWVLHMLRQVMGNAAFFQLLQAWAGPPNAYDNASTADLVALATIKHGASLDYFFDQWVYDEGRPLYEYWWNSTYLGGSYDVELRIKQVQITGPIFRMPIDIGIEVAGGDTLLFVADNSLEIETFHFEVAEEPVALHLDPFDWILKGAAQVDVTSPPAPMVRLALLPPHPNPAPAGGTTLTYSLPGPGAVRLSIYDPAGRLVTTLDEGWRPAGTHHRRWNGRNQRGHQTASGIYFLRLDSGHNQLHRRLVIVR